MVRNASGMATEAKSRRFSRSKNWKKVRFLMNGTFHKAFGLKPGPIDVKKCALFESDLEKIHFQAKKIVLNRSGGRFFPIFGGSDTK